MHETSEYTDLVGHLVRGIAQGGDEVVHLISDFFATYPGAEEGETHPAYLLCLIEIDGLPFPLHPGAQLQLMMGNDDFMRTVVKADPVLEGRPSHPEEHPFEVDDESAPQWEGDLDVARRFTYDGFEDSSLSVQIGYEPKLESLGGSQFSRWVSYTSDVPGIFDDEAGADPEVLLRYQLATGWAGARWVAEEAEDDDPDELVHLEHLELDAPDHPEEPLVPSDGD